MPFDWNNYLSLAEDLASKPDEASKRTAISRAYYCVFNLAFARAELTAGPYPKQQGYHKWCWSKYMATPDLSCRRLGVDGDRMFRLRVRADYDAADIPRLGDKVIRMLQDVHLLVAALAALNPRYPLP